MTAEELFTALEEELGPAEDLSMAEVCRWLVCNDIGLGKGLTVLYLRKLKVIAAVRCTCPEGELGPLSTHCKFHML